MTKLRDYYEDADEFEREAEYVADIRRRIEHVSGADLPMFQAAAE